MYIQKCTKPPIEEWRQSGISNERCVRKVVIVIGSQGLGKVAIYLVALRKSWPRLPKQFFHENRPKTAMK